jgi:hypothetical protein
MAQRQERANEVARSKVGDQRRHVESSPRNPASRCADGQVCRSGQWRQAEGSFFTDGYGWDLGFVNQNLTGLGAKYQIDVLQRLADRLHFGACESANIER